MLVENDIRQMLANFASQYGPESSMLAVVKDVQPDQCTCTLDDETGEYCDVRLSPITGANKGFVQIPKVGTTALAVRIEGSDEWMVVACTEIDKIQVIVGEEDFFDIANDLIKAIKLMKFTTNNGPTIKLLNEQSFTDIQKRIEKIMKLD